MMELTAQENISLINTSLRLGINPDTLYAMIDLESGWNPQAKNPNSSAKGLLQFIDSSAQDLGYQNSQDLIDQNPTIKDQLDRPVFEYLKQYAPFTDDQSLLMAVFYPVARTWPLDKEFPSIVQQKNPGIVTVEDYMNKVLAHADKKPSRLLMLGVAGLLAFGTALYITLRGKR